MELKNLGAHTVPGNIGLGRKDGHPDQERHVNRERYRRCDCPHHRRDLPQRSATIASMSPSFVLGGNRDVCLGMYREAAISQPASVRLRTQADLILTYMSLDTTSFRPRSARSARGRSVRANAPSSRAPA